MVKSIEDRERCVPAAIFLRGEPIEDATWRVAYVRFWPTLFPSSSSMENMCVHTHRARIYLWVTSRGWGKERNENHTHRKKSTGCG